MLETYGVYASGMTDFNDMSIDLAIEYKVINAVTDWDWIGTVDLEDTNSIDLLDVKE